MILSKPQIYENIKILPIIGQNTSNVDFLSLKEGLNLKLVEVKECQEETVGMVRVNNKSVNPLLLIDGEEIIGANQNRIINQTTIIPALKEIPVPVSCTERGRWSYKSEFCYSDSIADYDSRGEKLKSKISGQSTQSAVWESIEGLHSLFDVESETRALKDVYESKKEDLREYSDHFHVVDNQVGIMVAINGKFRGMELFYNHLTYKKFHKMVLDSYLLNVPPKETTIEDDLETIFNEILASKGIKNDSPGLEEIFEVKNNYCVGSVVNYEDNLVHASYFSS